MKVAGRQAVGEHHCALLLAKLPELPAVFIVNIKNGGARRVGPATFEKHLFGAEVIFHRAVVVEMVASEIREYSHIKRNSKNALLLQRMR